ncbi:MAG TPA: SurA N-terminal domain-containing protein [Streptosporangiaceae bacterium]|jgi:peptidyl-prolyl cis-trans isomerase SurA|nr:SurA N-terminal domain-containing protein [Streptosporangiaceae bacterium]
MRRSIDVPGTSMKLAAAVLAAGLAVAACGQVQMGAAAIVGSQRVSSSTLSDEVANLSAGYQAHKRQIQLQYPASQMPQQVLAWIVRFRVRNQLASRDGISVTTTDVRQALGQITASIKQSGESATLPEVAVANGLPPDMLNALGRYQAIETKLLNRLDGGKLPTASAAQQTLETKFNASQCRAAKSLNIKVNPQYGSLNYTDFSVVLTPAALSNPQSSAPTPAASRPVLTPPC